MLTRSHDQTWTFKKAFVLTGVDRLLQPGSYRVPRPNRLSLEMVTIDPAELQAAHERDAAGGSQD